MTEWLPPNVPWPRHDSPHWRETLAEARARGWHLRKQSDHGWGKLACAAKPDSFADPSMVCTKNVDGTATGSETHARLALGVIRRCPHKHEPVGDDPATAKSLLHDANRLLDGAQKLIAERRGRAEAEALMAEALEMTDEADELWEKADDAESAADAAHSDAGRLVAGVPHFTGEAEAEPVIAEAETRTDEAAAAAPEDVGVVQDVARTRIRISDLRRQLGGL